MDYESYLSESFTPLRAIEVLTDIIYEKSNNDWNIFSLMTREDGNELLALHYAIKLCAKHLLDTRNKEIKNINT